MDPPRGNVRARGRARQAREQARRPGNEPERGGAAAAPAAVYPAQGNGGGRRGHRGVPRADPLPPDQRLPPPSQIETVTEAMGAASLSETTGRGRSYPGTRSTSSNDRTRPEDLKDKTGISGEKVNLLTNYFKLVSKPKWCIYQYHCDFAPTVESSRMRRAFMRDHKETLGNCFLFDGMSDLKTPTQLGENLELFSQRNTDNETIRITLKRVNELAPSHPELQRLFNTQMRRNLQHLKFQLLGRHFFDPTAISEVDQYNLQIWPGVVTSIRQHETDVMMCVDTVHKVVRKETALNMIRDIADKNRGSSSYKDAVSKDLLGCVVMTRYNNKTYRIEDIDWSLTPKDTFEARDGPITFMDYLKQQYQIEVRDLGQPLLLCTSKEKEIRRGASVNKKIYLLPEFCLMTGLTEQMRSNFTVMRDLGSMTRVNPANRVGNLMRFIKRINNNQEVITEMNAWGLQFNHNLVNVEARIVPLEDIFLRNDLKKTCNREKDFTLLVRSDPMHVAVNLRDWLVIHTRFDASRVNDMLKTLMNVSEKLGMNIAPPRKIEIGQDRINSYLQACGENYQRSTQLVMFILPNNKKERYDALKKFTCVDHAMPSQVVVSRTISKPKNLMTVATKVAIQLNCKLGGEPWRLKIPLSKRLMICGYDTYHDSSRRGRSAGAFVASLNQNCTRWYSKVAFHEAGGWQELSNHMHLHFTMALKAYQEANNCLPELIIMYRDGVGDGQVGYVIDWELQQLQKVIDTQMKGMKVNFAFVIVNKKVNTRFFKDSRSGPISNPPHGTVVDTVVTRWDRYDFFLVSQLATQGTVAPTMYNVIHDKSGLKPEHFQRLSYKLTHLYFNCTGTISVPAPCQYAHKLAFLAGQSLHQEPREELCNRLFYL